MNCHVVKKYINYLVQFDSRIGYVEYSNNTFLSFYQFQ